MTTELFYTNNNGDGEVWQGNSDWTNCRNAGSGNADKSSETGSVRARWVGSPWNSYYIDRIFLPFDTSSIPDDAIIEYAILSVCFTSVSGGVRGIGLVQTTQSDPTNLSNDDYSRMGTTEGATRQTVTEAGFVDYTLNPTGLSWINKGGYSLLGLKDGLDIDNTSPSDSTVKLVAFSEDSYIYPYLSVSWSMPTTTTTTTTSTTSTSTTTTSTTSTSTTSTSTSTTSTSSSTSITTTSTTTLPEIKTIYGAKVLKPNVPGSSNDAITNLRDYYLNSKKVLLKIHKQGSFKAQFLGKGDAGGSITDITINFPELKSRPLVLVYMQRMTHVPDVDTDYHLLDWCYFGATQAGEHYVKVYNNKIVITYYDQDASLEGQPATALYGYYYIFEEEV